MAATASDTYIRCRATRRIRNQTSQIIGPDGGQGLTCPGLAAHSMARNTTKETLSVAEKVLAAVRTGPGKTEIREYPMPDVPEDAALMKVEVGGICGTDVKLYAHPPNDKPTIMGHENIGFISKAGREFTRRKGFKEGDLVFVEHYVMCGKCEWCHLGQYRHCENTNWRTNPDAIRYGYTPDA